jgi:hypothetical protein
MPVRITLLPPVSEWSSSEWCLQWCNHHLQLGDQQMPPAMCGVSSCCLHCEHTLLVVFKVLRTANCCCFTAAAAAAVICYGLML